MKKEKHLSNDRYGMGYLLRNFSKKYRISIREQASAEGETSENGGEETEIWYTYMSNRRIVFTVLAALFVMFALVALLVVFTPILDRLPGNPGVRNRERLSEEIEKIDSLENELALLIEYSRNVATIMEGRAPETLTTDAGVATEQGRQAVSRSEQDSLLRRQIEGGGRYGLNTRPAAGSTTGNRMRFFTSPVEATIASGFDPAAGNYGVVYTITEPQQVVAVRGGTVIMSMWTPSDDYIIQVQHKDNAISIYKHNSRALKNVGDYVEEGEAIGYVGGTGGVAAGSRFAFELWLDGRPVDPESFISYY